MAAYAALVSLMNNMEQIMKHPHLSSSLDKKQTEYLLEKAGLLLDIIEGDKYGGVSEEAKDLERRITSAAHAAEDVIEFHIVDQILAPSAADDDRETIASSSFLLSVKKKIKDMKKKAHHLKRRMACAADHATDQSHVGMSFTCSLDLQQMIEDMDVVVEKAMHMQVKAKEGAKEEQPTHPGPFVETEETGMVGLDDELTQLLDGLAGNQSYRYVISVVGMGGMGKTTLAKNIYANPFIIEHFDIRAWATVSQLYKVEEILSQLLSCLGIIRIKEEDELGELLPLREKKVGQLGEQLHKNLIGRRYLIILDDIWSVEAWDQVRRYFPDDGSSSRVVLTTRLSNVASVCSSSCITMNILDKDKSWQLFCEKALFPPKDGPPKLENVGKEIVRLCKGLPLSIVVIGGLLRKSRRTVGYWNYVANSIKSTRTLQEKQESLDVLSLSYNNLPQHLKPCFLYMGAFEEDYDFSVSTITRLWVAEDFVRPNGTQVLEEIAEGYLEDLIDRNLILVGRRRGNGKIGSCSIHDLLKDLCVKVGEEQDFFHVRKYLDIRGRDRRVACDPYEMHIGSSTACFQDDTESSLVRSILTKNYYTESVKCKLLRVLGDAENRVHKLPVEVLYENVNLRYLAYQHPYDTRHSWNLPTSVSLIWNLQTIVMTPQHHEFPLVVAPSEIWKMHQLRHVKFPNIYLPHPPPSDGQDDLTVLENLQTLTIAVNLRLSEGVCKIIPNIKKLSFTCDHYSLRYDDSLIECLFNLDRLCKLVSLKIKIKIGSSKLQAPDYKKLKFPSSLKKLSLSDCRLGWEDLTMIGLLPRLQVLYLENLYATEGGKWSPDDGQFLHLKFLKIDQCELSCWDANNSHFPVLEKLLLRHLKKLKEIPEDIGDIPTLKLIRLEYCSEFAAISAMRIKEIQQEVQENDDLQVQIRISKYDLDSFKKMVEREELTLTSIQLET